MIAVISASHDESAIDFCCLEPHPSSQIHPARDRELLYSDRELLRAEAWADMGKGMGEARGWWSGWRGRG